MGENLSTSAPDPIVDVLPAGNDFDVAAAEAVATVIATAIEDRGQCLIALSGGNTPRGAYRKLGDLLTTRMVDLSRVHLIFVDERMVPPDDPESNYRMVRRELISRVSPQIHVYRIRGEIEALEAARDYETELEPVMKGFEGRCDLIVLGVGEDGHTASLFPGTDVVRERRSKVRAVFVPRLASWRVTLTLPVITSARTVLFLVSGQRKAAIIGNIFAGDVPREDLPASLVHPESGTLTWMLDAEAASELPSEV
ncbi:MAG: 6-phosphogluconolactonase [Rhodothermales bacterium]